MNLFANPLITRLCWLSIATAVLLFGSTVLDECVAKPFKAHRSPATSQSMLTATIASNGTALTVTFNRAMVAADADGFTLIVAAVPEGLTLASGSGTDTFVFTADVVYEGEIVSLAYSSETGDVQDLSGVDLENDGISVTNNSTQDPTPDDTTPPEFVSATIASNGLNAVYVFDEAVELANADGFTLTPSGGAATLTYASGSGTTTINFTLSRAIELDETATTEYLELTGDVADLYGNELADITSTSVTNNSTYDSSSPYTPVAPETFNTDYDLPVGGTTYTPADSAALTTALASAVGGDVIVLTAGTTYTGPFKLRDWGAGTDWIYIISSDLADLPPEGERVAIADAVDMPTLISNTNAPLHSDFGAHHYRLAGIEVEAGARDHLAACQFGYNGDFTDNADVDSDQVHHVTFDRCLIHSTSDAHRLRHGIMLNGKYMAVLDCYIANCKDTGGTDANAIFCHDGSGPFKIVNNFLEGSGMSVMFGGSDTAITNLVPSDIEFRGNHLFKRLTWKTIATPSWGVKNSFELKNAQRVLASGNVIENCWAKNQDGCSVLFTVRNQSGTNSWATVRDVDFENNIINNVGCGLSVSGEDNNHPSQQTQRIRVNNNLMTEVTRDYSLAPFFFYASTPSRPALYVTFTHNTCLSPTDEVGPGNHISFNSPLPCVDGLILQDNIMVHGSYNPDWTGRSANATHSHNVIAMMTANSRYAVNKSFFATWHPGDFMADPNQTAIGFVNLAGGDYNLDVTSTFKGDGTGGSDPGCDISELETATAGAVSGVW